MDRHALLGLVLALADGVGMPDNAPPPKPTAEPVIGKIDFRVPKHIIDNGHPLNPQNHKQKRKKK